MIGMIMIVFSFISILNLITNPISNSKLEPIIANQRQSSHLQENLISASSLPPHYSSAPVFTPTTTPQLSPSPTTNPTATPLATNLLYQISMLGQINQYRQTFGLSSVSLDTRVCQFATIRAREISQNFNHDGFQQRITEDSFPYNSYSQVVENIALADNDSLVVNMWIDSATHAENIRKDTPYVCVIRQGSFYVYAGWRP